VIFCIPLHLLPILVNSPACKVWYKHRNTLKAVLKHCMGCQKWKFVTWGTNLWNYNLSKKKKTENSVSEGSKDKENVPVHVEGLHLGSVHQTQNWHQIKPTLGCAEGLNALVNLLLLLLFTPWSVREPFQAGVGQLPRKDPKRIKAMGNQMLGVGNLSNA